MSNKDNNSQIPVQALELLPLYTLGLLEVEEKQFMEKALLEFPELQEQLETEYEMVQHLREEKELFSLSAIEEREERLGQLLKRDEFQPKVFGQQEAKIKTKLVEFFQDLFLGRMSKPQYMGFAAVTTLSIALLFAFAVPLLESESTFYPAASEPDEATQEKNSLLIGLSVAPDDPKLLKVLKNYDIKTTTIAEKDGMYRLSFTKKKPNAADLEKLLSTLSKETELFWFVGEAY
jgi:hypothetical protein